MYVICGRCMSIWCLQISENDIGFPGTEIKMLISHHVCTTGYWELNPGTLQDQLVLLISEPTLAEVLNDFNLSILVIVI